MITESKMNEKFGKYLGRVTARPFGNLPNMALLTLYNIPVLQFGPTCGIIAIGKGEKSF